MVRSMMLRKRRRRPEVGDRAFEQVAGVVEFVVVAQVRPALVGLALVVPAIEVAVGRLRPREIVDDRVNLGFDVLIAPVRQGVTRRFDPLADVRVPENLHGEAMRVARNGERGNGLRQLQRLEDADLLELGVLARNRALEDCLYPLAPELAGDPDFRERHRGIGALCHDPLSVPSDRLAPQELRTTREQGSRRTPQSLAPAIISSRAAPTSRPSVSRFMSTLVSRGRVASVITSQLSKPTTATSVGTARPISRSASIAPRAIWSLPQKSASGTLLRCAKRRCAASRPQASDQRPGREGSTGRPASAIAARKPRSRRRTASKRSGPVIEAMRLRPRPARCRTASFAPPWSSGRRQNASACSTRENT